MESFFMLLHIDKYFSLDYYIGVNIMSLHIMKEENPCHSEHQNTMENQNSCCNNMQDYRLFNNF